MNKKHRKRKLSGRFVLLFIAALFLLAAVLVSVSTLQNDKHPAEKTLIIFAEALPYHIVNNNLDALPNIKSLCDDGRCLSMRPASPTFTTVQNYELATGDDVAEAAYAYNFFINTSDFYKNSCSFVGEISTLARPSQENLYAEIAERLRFAQFSIERTRGEEKERYSADIFPAIPRLLAQNDVVSTYVTDTDSHFTNLTHLDQDSDIVRQFKRFDIQLGLLLQALKERGLYENTNIILYGDHGMAGIERFEYLNEHLARIGAITNLDDVCYWNDAGTSIRFWVLPKAQDRKEGIKNKIADYFNAHGDCFYTVTDDILKSENMQMSDDETGWLSYGDVFIAVKPECKVNSGKVSGGMENGFAEHQNKVDRYISMHGYINSSHPELQAFVSIRTVRQIGIPERFTIKDLHRLVKQITLKNDTV